MTSLRSLLLGLVAGVVGSVLLAVVAPLALGWRPLTVMSGSMEPTISTGDVVVSRPIVPAAARPGSVVTFRDPSHAGRLITHRLRRNVDRGASREMTTRGDANNTTETWTVAEKGRIGLVMYRVPFIGFVLAPVASPAGRILLVGIPLLVWGALSIRTVWREEEPACA